MSRRGGEGGQVTILVLGLALVAFATAGLAVDGTRAWLARRTLQNAADSSALAAASEIDESVLYTSGGRTVLLEPRRARTVAAEWLVRRGVEVRSQIDATQEGVRVLLAGDVRTTFLSLVGIRAVPVAAEATAEPLPGAR